MRVFPTLAFLVLALSLSQTAQAQRLAPDPGSPPGAAAFSGDLLTQRFVKSEASGEQDEPDEEALAIIRELGKTLDTGTPKERADAIELLAAYGGTEATEFVLGALDHEDPYVADLAQALIPDLETPDLLKTLYGRGGLKSKDKLIRHRIAEALGRFQGPLDAEPILKATKTKDERMARLLLWSLERLAVRRALTGKIERTIKGVRRLTGRGDKDRVRAAALQVLSQLDPHDGAISLDNLKDTTGLETASCLMDTFQRLKPPGYVEALLRGTRHPDSSVRMRAVDVLMRGGVTRGQLTSLITQLHDEPRVAVRRRIVTALKYFTGEALGDDAKAWQKFAKGLSVGWSTAETNRSIFERAKVSGGLEELSGLNPTSDRVAILLDVSKSFWAETEDGPTRAELVLPEIELLLERIEQTGTFYLLPFGDELAPWKDAPVTASRETVREAGRFLREELPKRTKKDQGSDIYAAISKALDFKELDSIIVITGASSYVGDHGSSSLMVKLFMERSRFRPAIFDFVLLGEVGLRASRWGKLAASRGGCVYSISFD